MTKVVSLCALAAFPIGWHGVTEWPELQWCPHELLIAGYVVSTAIGGLIVWGFCSGSDGVPSDYGQKKKARC